MTPQSTYRGPSSSQQYYRPEMPFHSFDEVEETYEESESPSPPPQPER